MLIRWWAQFRSPERRPIAPQRAGKSCSHRPDSAFIRKGIAQPKRKKYAYSVLLANELITFTSEELAARQSFEVDHRNEIEQVQVLSSKYIEK
jgi:hypothetical protein